MPIDGIAGARDHRQEKLAQDLAINYFFKYYQLLSIVLSDKGSFYRN